MNIQRRQLILVPDETEQPQGEIGRLDILDELFNALHGVGDVDRELKEMVLLIVADIHGGGHYFSTIDKIEKKEMLVEIIKVIYAALRNRPAVAKAALQRWMMELSRADSPAIRYPRKGTKATKELTTKGSKGMVGRNGTASEGISFFSLLFIVFLTLKLIGEIDWSWWWITAPLWGPLATLAIIAGISLAFGFCVHLWKSKIVNRKS